MTDAPRPPYCLSRQRPELAARSLAIGGPMTSRANQPASPPPSQAAPPPRKHL
jgi:hypothetical protein